MAALMPITAAWGMNSFPRAEKAVMPYPMAMGREMVAAETAPSTSPLILATLILHPFHIA
jgi:hypothetical protein